MEEFISAYVYDTDYLGYDDALALAIERDNEATLNFLLSLEIGAAVQARLERDA